MFKNFTRLQSALEITLHNTTTTKFLINNKMLKLWLILMLSVCLTAGIPRPLETDDLGDDVCLTSAEQECVFPFTYNNFTFNGCPTDLKDKTKRWCSVKTDENGVHIAGNETWGYCTSGCRPEISRDELTIVTNATDEVQTDTCDYTACNGFKLRLEVFDKVQTYGQCQYQAGKNGSEEDYFCFVNADSACKDKVEDGDGKEVRYTSTLACKDPNAPLPRSFFSWGYTGGYGYYGYRHGYYRHPYAYPFGYYGYRYPNYYYGKPAKSGCKCSEYSYEAYDGNIFGNCNHDIGKGYFCYIDQTQNPGCCEDSSHTKYCPNYSICKGADSPKFKPLQNGNSDDVRINPRQ